MVKNCFFLVFFWKNEKVKKLKNTLLLVEWKKRHVSGQLVVSVRMEKNVVGQVSLSYQSTLVKKT